MTANELVLTFGDLHLSVQFGENRQRNATVRVTTHGQTNKHTHTHTATQSQPLSTALSHRYITHTQTDGQTGTNRFYYLSHAICYSYGADKDLRNRTQCNIPIVSTISYIRVYTQLL